MRRTLGIAAIAMVATAWCAPRAPGANAPSARAASKITESSGPIPVLIGDVFPPGLPASLKLVPEDAAFYCASLRMADQVQAVRKSRAWKAMVELPAMRHGLAILRKKLAEEPQTAMLKVVWENPEVQTAVATLGDMFSQEAFACGDGRLVDFLHFVQEVQTAMNFGPLAAQLKGEGADPSIQARVALRAAVANARYITAPGVIFGFRVKDVDRVKQELDKLEILYNVASMAAPPLVGKLKRTTVAGCEYLALSLDGQMVPWDRLPLDRLKEMEENPGDADKVIAAIKKLTLVVAVGLRDDFLLLSVGPSLDSLARLGKGKLLSARAELAPMRQKCGYATWRLTNVSYLSQATADLIFTNSSDIDRLVKLLDDVLKQVALPATQEQQVRKDAAALAKDLKRLIPGRGPVLGFSFLTDRGQESYQYAWGKWGTLGGQKPLSLLEHVGGHPLFLAVGRSAVTVQDYNALVHWLKVGYRYFEEYGRPEMSAEWREILDAKVEAWAPVLERADRINRTLLFPALSDGQVAVALDANLKTTRLSGALAGTLTIGDEGSPEVTTMRLFGTAGPTSRPLPCPQLAVLVGVSNAEILRKAMEEYRHVLGAALAAGVQSMHGYISAVLPQFKVPIVKGLEVELPAPQATKFPHGTLYWYAFPDEWGWPKQLKVVLGLAEHVAVVSPTEDQAQRLLKATPLSIGGLLGRSQRPRVAAVALDWAGIVEAATPWIDLAAREIGKQQGVNVDAPLGPTPEKKRGEARKKAETGQKPNAGPGPAGAGKTPPKAKKAAPRASILDQVHMVLQVLKTLRQVTQETYLEGNALVTHVLVEIRDIE
jgi:hypothetical protein